MTVNEENLDNTTSDQNNSNTRGLQNMLYKLNFSFTETEPINKHPNLRSCSITTPPTTPIEINVDGSCCQASPVCH